MKPHGEWAQKYTHTPPPPPPLPPPPQASRVVHITKDFLTCYSCSHYSSMLKFYLLDLILRKTFFVIGMIVRTLYDHDQENK